MATVTPSAIDLDNLDGALSHGFSIPAAGDAPEINVEIVDGEYLIQLSLIHDSLPDGQVRGLLTNAEAVRLAMALLALAESNR